MRSVYTLKLVIAAAALVLLSGCATVMDGGPDRVNVNSSPPGANVYVDGKHVGTTPTTVALDRGQSGLIEFRKDGYETTTVYQNQQLNGWLIGSICLGFWPLIIDVITENHQKFEDRPANVTLTPAREAADPLRSGEPISLKRQSDDDE